ncbi:MAG TPA: hypothetical protein VFH40_01075 [Gemmatimonadales bacterium]|jgi:hypothetical protein|nr:hypothetical protein [Gemmatimonadales bacterium]
MRLRLSWLVILLLIGTIGCEHRGSSRTRHSADDSNLPPDERDAHILGREIFELVDRAIDYRGSHQGRPAATFRQMGIESLTTNTVRRVVNVQREPLVTVAFRKPSGREILSCRGDSQILEQAAIRGRFTIMCTASSGAQRPMEVEE